MENLTRENMLAARLRRDITYDGKFYVGVRTMKTYCLPSCKAKLANEENMVFFLTRESAIIAGYRGCKRCKAELYPATLPSWLDDIIAYMKKEISNKIDEKTLVQIANVDITTIRRHFKTHYNISPMAYHRKLRIAHAKYLIEKGVDYKKIPKLCGFKSDSGFRTAFFKEFGHSPGEYNHVRHQNSL